MVQPLLLAVGLARFRRVCHSPAISHLPIWNRHMLRIDWSDLLLLCPPVSLRPDACRVLFHSTNRPDICYSILEDIVCKNRTLLSEVPSALSVVSASAQPTKLETSVDCSFRCAAA